MQTRYSDRELWPQIADQIEALIDLGEFPVGKRLPGHRALRERFGVSDTVMAKAVDALISRDRIEVRPRSGMFALPKPPPRTRMPLGMVVRRNPLGYLFNAHSGRWPALAVPTREEILCPRDIAASLGIDEGDLVLARRRVVGPRPGEPAQVTVTYLPLPLVRQAPVLGEVDTGPGGYIEVIEHELGHGPVRWPAEVSSRLPSPDEARDLQMPAQQPVLVETRIVTDPLDEEHPLAVDVAVRDGRRWSLTYELQRDASAAWPTTPATERNVLARADTPATQGEGAEPASSGPKR